MTYSLADFCRFSAKLRTEAGKPLHISTFQRRLLAPYFKGTRETVIVLPTGNGKTTLLAALGLYHMLKVPNASVLIVAAAADQAATLFGQMRTLILESAYADLLDVKNGIRAIYHAGTPSSRRPGVIRVIASDVGKQEGAIPTLVLVDELHAHQDLAMYEMLRDKLWKRGQESGCGRMIAISTAGFSFESPLWKMKERVMELDTFAQNGCNHATAANFEWLEYAMDPDQDREDIRLVAKVNPAPWITQATLRERRSFTTSPGEWARTACNVWTAGAEQPISPEDWDRLRVDIGAISEGDDVILVPSVGHNAAIGIAAQRPDGKVAVHAEVLEPVEGTSILVRTEQAVMELCERYQVREVQYPLAGFIRSSDYLKAEGIPMVEAPHSPARMAAATGTFNRLLLGGMLMHDGDPTLRAHVLAASLKVSESGERFDMSSDRSRALTAVAFAVHAATAEQEKVPVIHVWKGA